MRKKTVLVGVILFVIVSLLAPLAFVQWQRYRSLIALAGAQAQASNPIVAENQLPGTRDWLPTNPVSYNTTTHRAAAIEGYATKTSVAPGETIGFAISTTAPSFQADIYRLGWYGGTGARLLKTVAHLPGSFYTLPSMDSSTGLVEAHWPVAFSLTIPASWTTGMYLVKLTSSVGKQSYVPFTLRSLQYADLAFIHASNTENAYNSWGGASLYSDETGTLAVGRAFKVSYDRPLANGSISLPGSGNLLLWEYPMIRWLEMRGYNVSYYSDVDLETNPGLALQHRAVLIVGHSEYWSKGMRDAITQAISRGINIGNFGGNDIYRQVRFEPEVSGQHLPDRVVVCYKDWHYDPLYGKDNALVTVGWRDFPVEQPEQAFLGSMWESWFTNKLPGAAWVVADASNWVMSGTGLRNGDSIPGIVGYEFDAVSSTAPQPPGVDVIAASPVTDDSGAHDIANTTVYTAASGATVFNAGTIWWPWGLDGFNQADHHTRVVSPYIQRITLNVLSRFLLSGRLRVHQATTPTTTVTPGAVMPKGSASPSDPL